MYKSLFVLLVLSVVKNVLGTSPEVSIIQIDSRMAITEKFTYSADLEKLPIVSFYLLFVFTMPLNESSSLPVIDSTLESSTNYDGDNIVFATLECDSPTPTYWIYNKSTPTLNVFDLNRTDSTPIRLLLDWSRLVNQNYALYGNINITMLYNRDSTILRNSQFVNVPANQYYYPRGTVKVTTINNTILRVETLNPIELRFYSAVPEEVPYFVELSFNGLISTMDQSEFRDEKSVQLPFSNLSITLKTNINPYTSQEFSIIPAEKVVIDLNVSSPFGPICSEREYEVKTAKSYINIVKSGSDLQLDILLAF